MVFNIMIKIPIYFTGLIKRRPLIFWTKLEMHPTGQCILPGKSVNAVTKINSLVQLLTRVKNNKEYVRWHQIITKNT